MTPFVREGRAPQKLFLKPPQGIEVKGKEEGCSTLLQYNLTPTEAHWLQAPGHQDQEPIASLAQCWPGLFQLGRVYLPKKKVPASLGLALCPQAGPEGVAGGGESGQR